MLVSRFVVRILSVALMGSSASLVSGQDYPNKPIRIVTSAVGGGSDYLSRLITPGLTRSLRQPVITDNRGGDIIPGEIVAKAPPDGHTLLITGGSFWLVPFLYSAAPWDPVRDFVPIILTDESPNVLVVNPSLPVNSVKELIALAKAKPGELNYSSAGSGGSLHLAAELFNSMTGVKITRVIFKGAGPAVVGLLAGEVQLTFASPIAAAPYLKSGKLKGLAVTSAEPSALAPGLPTVASGVPGYESVSRSAIFAPANTPRAIIHRLNQEISRELGKEEVIEKLFNVGTKVVTSSPEELAAKMKSEMARWGKVIKDTGIKAN